jgi:hypothetical protein
MVLLSAGHAGIIQQQGVEPPKAEKRLPSLLGPSVYISGSDRLVDRTARGVHQCSCKLSTLPMPIKVRITPFTCQQEMQTQDKADTAPAVLP